MEEPITKEWLEAQGTKVQGEIATGDAHAVVLTLKSGDVLAITYEYSIPMEECYRMQRFLEELFPDNKVLILQRGPKLTVLHSEA